jgi:antitoxin component YwqK of YwqJK toxin-antitoxin module
MLWQRDLPTYSSSLPFFLKGKSRKVIAAIDFESIPVEFKSQPRASLPKFSLVFIQRSKPLSLEGGKSMIQPISKQMLLLLLFAISVTVAAAPVEQDKVKKQYYTSGAIQFEYNYRNNKLHGTTTEYYETGERKAEYNYKDGQLIAQKDYTRAGSLSYELKYEEGKKIEAQIEYYPTGELFRQRNFVNGKREGVELEFYRNGKKKAERNYKNGRKEGSAKGYHINGKLQGDWLFNNDEPKSATIFYNTGEKWLVHTDFDKKGRLNGTSREYDKKGNLIAIRYYKDDEMVQRKRVNKWWDWWWIWLW